MRKSVCVAVLQSRNKSFNRLLIQFGLLRRLRLYSFVVSMPSCHIHLVLHCQVVSSHCKLRMPCMRV